MVRDWESFWLGAIAGVLLAAFSFLPYLNT